MKHSLYVFMLLVSCLHPGTGYAQRAHQAQPVERIQPAEHMQPTGRTPPPAELANLFATAREQNKNVLAYITASWCSACHEFEKEVLPLPEVTDSLKNFAFVKASLDESALGALLARKYSLQTIPAFLLISPSGELLHYQTGIGVGTIFFFQMMADYKVKNRIRGYSTDFAMHYPDFYQTFFPSYKNAPDSSAIDRYLDTQSDLESEVNFDIFMTMPTGIRYKSYFLSHGLSFSEKYGPIYGERVDRLYLSDLRRMIREKDTAAYRLLEDAHYFVDSIKGHDPERLKRLRYLSFLGKSGLDWEEYIRELERWEEKYGNSSILNYCDDVIENCTLPAVCKKMAGYLGTELTSSKDSNEDVYFKFAVLLKRGGENDQALQALTRALTLSPDEEKRTMLKTAWDLPLKQ